MPDPTDLQAVFDSALSEHPEKIALRYHGQYWSYRELDRRVSAVAAGMIDRGIAAGDRVAWLLPNSLEAVLTSLACWRIGAIVVPLNYRYVADEATDVLMRVRAKLLVFHASREEVALPFLQARPGTLAFEVGQQEKSARDSFAALSEHRRTVLPAAIDSDSPCLILFTSGSTGHPKGAVHTHYSTYNAIAISREIFDFQCDDVVLVGKPLSHAGGLLTQMMPTFHAGAEVVLTVRPTPADAVALIKHYGVTEYGMLASDLLDFIEYLETHAEQLPTLKNSVGSGDSVPTDLHHRFRDLLGWEVMECCGMTELGGYYAANPRYGERKWGSVGPPAPHCKLKLIDREGEPCAPGKVGEVAINTPCAAIGYWEDDEASNDLFADGWLLSGDLARVDEDGYYWFVGRKKLIIVRRGSNIAPAEVENVLDEHPAVHAAVVVGVHDDRDGQIPVAFVQLLESSDSTSEQDLSAFAHAHLAKYMCPVHYILVPDLPRNVTGKFDRHLLQQQAEKQFGA
ncbi:MAG: class I adenylate-forming enzyme family protein [Pseudomonadota bacterium]